LTDFYAVEAIFMIVGILTKNVIKNLMMDGSFMDW